MQLLDVRLQDRHTARQTWIGLDFCCQLLQALTEIG
jgi:hypothetical protein